MMVPTLRVSNEAHIQKLIDSGYREATAILLLDENVCLRTKWSNFHESFFFDDPCGSRKIFINVEAFRELTNIQHTTSINIPIAEQSTLDALENDTGKIHRLFVKISSIQTDIVFLAAADDGYEWWVEWSTNQNCSVKWVQPVPAVEG